MREEREDRKDYVENLDWHQETKQEKKQVHNEFPSDLALKVSSLVP